MMKFLGLTESLSTEQERSYRRISRINDTGGLQVTGAPTCVTTAPLIPKKRALEGILLHSERATPLEQNQTNRFLQLLNSLR
ncbi:hypothetical protein TNCV_4110071 [Trichonephila clavipes]|nr:hypothetical protein TNCV_4110071 [Trichonephila clavipes]